MKNTFQLNGLALIFAPFLWVFFHPGDLGIVGELGVALALLSVGIVLVTRTEAVLEWLAPEESILGTRSRGNDRRNSPSSRRNHDTTGYRPRNSARTAGDTRAVRIRPRVLY